MPKILVREWHFRTISYAVRPKPGGPSSKAGWPILARPLRKGGIPLTPKA